MMPLHANTPAAESPPDNAVLLALSQMQAQIDAMVLQARDYQQQSRSERESMQGTVNRIDGRVQTIEQEALIARSRRRAIAEVASVSWRAVVVLGTILTTLITGAAWLYDHVVRALK